MKGTRVPDGVWPENLGEYSKHKTNKGIIWFVRPPKDGISSGSLEKHTIVEHEDGTITVSPSILFVANGQHTGWHGFLEHGVWREC